MKTAVEWLVEQLNKQGFAEVVTNDEIEQALEMEKEQSHKYAQFAIICDREDVRILDFEDYTKLETFKSE